MRCQVKWRRSLAGQGRLGKPVSLMLAHVHDTTAIGEDEDRKHVPGASLLHSIRREVNNVVVSRVTITRPHQFSFDLSDGLLLHAYSTQIGIPRHRLQDLSLPLSL